MRGREEEERCEEETSVNEGCVEPSRDRSHRGNCWLVMELLVYYGSGMGGGGLLVGPAAKDSTFSKKSQPSASSAISCDFARLAALCSNSTSQEWLHLCREVTLHQTGGL